MFLSNKLKMKLKWPPRLHSIQKWYNQDVNKILEQAAQERCKQKFNFLIDLASIAMVQENTKSTEDEPQTFNDA